MSSFRIWMMLAAAFAAAGGCSRSVLLPIDDGGGGARATVGPGPSGATSTTTGAGGFPMDRCDDAPFIRGIGGPGTQAVTAVASAPSCRITVFGLHDEAFDVDGRTVPHEASRDSFVVQMNGRGEARWALALADSGDASPFGVTGTTVNSERAALWTSFSGEGSIGGEAVSSAGGTDAALVSVSADGEVEWIVTIGDEDEQYARAITSDPQGQIYVAGNFRGTLTLPGQTLSSTTQYNSFIIKVAPDGDILWGFQFPEPAVASIEGLLWRDDVLYVTGTLGATVVGLPGGPLEAFDLDVFTVALDAPTGSYVFGRSFPSPGPDFAFDLAADGGVVFVAGQYEGTLDLPGMPSPPADGIDGFLMVLAEPVFDPIFIQPFAGPGAQRLNTLVATSGVSLLGGGDFEQLVSTPGAPPTSTPAAQDGFLFVPPGAVRALGADVEAAIDDMALARAQGSVLFGGRFNGTISPGPLLQSLTAQDEDGFVALLPAPN